MKEVDTKDVVVKEMGVLEDEEMAKVCEVVE